MARIGNSELTVHPLSLGGNVFGWTADEATSFAVLDAYAAAAATSSTPPTSTRPGSTAIPAVSPRRSSASGWPGAATATTSSSPPRSARHPDFKGLTAETIKTAAEASLRRLGTDHIDLYYSHFDDPDTPGRGDRHRAGRAGEGGQGPAQSAPPTSRAERLAASLDFAEREGLTRYVILQPHYNLVEREHYEGPLADRSPPRRPVRRPLLRPGRRLPHRQVPAGRRARRQRPRGQGGGSTSRRSAAPRVLAALDEVASAHDAEVASVALAWLRAQPTVVAPIASARTPEQLPALLASATLDLTGAEVAALSAAAA